MESSEVMKKLEALSVQKQELTRKMGSTESLLESAKSKKLELEDKLKNEGMSLNDIKNKIASIEGILAKISEIYTQVNQGNITPAEGLKELGAMRGENEQKNS